MSQPIIEVKNLSKQYRIGVDTTYKTLSESVTTTLRHPIRTIRGFNKQDEIFWALRDINFTVNRGEVVGIIGRNGAGKSTLLKVLSRITHPTEGEVILRGRVGSLLEVGTGFHPELTGRENIYFNGAILGMKKREIDEKFDEIVQFAEIEKFLDTPVKRYSSGMYVRLAFAVAAHMDPEILIVDEVLAVGDAAFQKKCLGKMGEVAEGGRTVLFVSHNMGAVQNLCHRCIWIESGKICNDNSSEKVISDYMCDSQNLSGQTLWELNYTPGDKELIYFTATRIMDSHGAITSCVYIEEPFYIELEYEILQPLQGAWIGFKLSTSLGDVVFCSGDHNFTLNESITRKPGIYKSRCQIPSNLLNQGSYIISLLGHIPGEKILVDEEGVLNFEVLQKTAIAGSGKQPGIIRPDLLWLIQTMD